MIIFLIICIVLIIVIFNSNKKGIAHPPPRVKPVRPAMIPVNPQPKMASQELASKHFGIKWRLLLESKPSQLNVTNQTIRYTVALCYDQLSPKQLELLLDSFINLKAQEAHNNLETKLSADSNDYSMLHNGIYGLVISKKFNELEIVKLLRQLGTNTPIPFSNTSENKQTPLQSPRSYANPISTQQPEKRTDSSIIEISQHITRIDTEFSNSSFTASSGTIYAAYDPDEYKLGKKYKAKLGLSAQEEIWLNKFYDYSNNFNSIEGCRVAIIKLYLLSIKRIVRVLANEEYALSKRIDAVKNAAYRYHKSQPGYWDGYDSAYIKENAEGDLYHTLYRKSEAAIRIAWDHKRKISPDYNSGGPEAINLFKKHLDSIMDEVITYLLPTVGIPDEETELLLNEANTTRWKIKFEHLTDGYIGSDHKALVEQIHLLAKLNAKNPSIENIYYEASKFMVAFDKVESLKLYLHYIYQDLLSIKIDNKALNKTIQKKLFANQEQLDSFQIIVNELSKTKGLDKALLDVLSIYKAKRKSITLNTEAIKRVEQQHSGTVEILNEYLKDDDDEAVYELQSPIDNNFGKVEALMQTASVAISISTVVSLNATEKDCLMLFQDNDYCVTASELENFAKRNSLFKNQLIDTINESCYEMLDDVLIEEDEDYYTINPDYLNRIII